MSLLSLFVRNAVTVTALLVPRLSALPPIQVRPHIQNQNSRPHLMTDPARRFSLSPVAIATLSTILFTALVYASSFLTTTLLSSLDDPSYTSYDSFSSSSVYFTRGGGFWTWTNPYTLGRDLVRAALRIIQDESGGVFGPDAFLASFASDNLETMPNHSVVWRFARRIVLGLPVVGAVSLIHMLFSLPFLGPLQWIARSRGNRGRRNSGSRDTAAVVIILLLAIGALR